MSTGQLYASDGFHSGMARSDLCFENITVAVLVREGAGIEAGRRVFAVLLGTDRAPGAR